MACFTNHAVQRFQTRRQYATSIQESYGLGQLISREEAAARIRGPVYPGFGDYFFRADGTGPGVWVSCFWHGKELVITYLVPSSHRPRKLRTKILGKGVYRVTPGPASKSVKAKALRSR